MSTGSRVWQREERSGVQCGRTTGAYGKRVDLAAGACFESTGGFAPVPYFSQPKSTRCDMLQTVACLHRTAAQFYFVIVSYRRMQVVCILCPAICTAQGHFRPIWVCHRGDPSLAPTFKPTPGHSVAPWCAVPGFGTQVSTSEPPF